jgi:hypothetical protein
LSLVAAGCGLLESEPEPSGAVMVLLPDLSESGVAAQDAQRRHVTEVFAGVAAEHEARVLLASIDEAALDDPHIDESATFDTSAAQGNPKGREDIRRLARATLAEEVYTLFAAASSGAPKTDLSGALAWAAATLRTAGTGWKGIAVLGDAVSTAAPCNMLLAPPVDVDTAIAACFPAGVPDLAGVEVWFAGATAYAGTDRPPVAADVLEQFWTAVVERGGGTVVAFAPTVLPESVSAQGVE